MVNNQQYMRIVFAGIACRRAPARRSLPLQHQFPGLLPPAEAQKVSETLCATTALPARIENRPFLVSWCPVSFQTVR